MRTNERRHNPRVKLDHVAYINLNSVNGGIVLDVSNEGLGFQAVAPFAIKEPIRFSLSVGSIDGAEAAGELMWADETGKRGGLRFTFLSKQVGEQIRIWLGQPASASPVFQDPTPAAAAGVEIVSARKGDSTSTRADGPLAGDRSDSFSTARSDRTPDPVEPHRSSPRQASVRGGFPPGLATPEALAPRQPRNWPPLLPPEPGLVAEPRLAQSFDAVPSRNNPAAIVFVLALGVVIGILLFVYKREAGELLIRLGEGISGETHLQPAAGAVLPTPSSSVESAPVSGAASDLQENHGPPAEAAPKSQPQAAAEQPTGAAAPEPGHEGLVLEARSLEPSSAGPARKTARDRPARIAERDRAVHQSEDSGGADLALARNYLREARGPGNSAAAVQLLWSAVQKGSSDAEVDLAELYLRGNAVQKNCEQARVLLTAANNRNNPAAGQKLAELSRYGCK
jgi:PilZ domain